METSSLNSISLSLYNLWNLCNLSKNAICSRCLRFVSFMVVWKGNPEYLHRLHYVFTLANLQQGFFMELFKAFHQSIALSYLYKKNHGSLSLSLFVSDALLIYHLGRPEIVESNVTGSCSPEHVQVFEDLTRTMLYL